MLRYYAGTDEFAPLKGELELTCPGSGAGTAPAVAACDERNPCQLSVTSGKRVLLLRAASAEEAEDWVRALRLATAAPAELAAMRIRRGFVPFAQKGDRLTLSQDGAVATKSSGDYGWTNAVAAADESLAASVHCWEVEGPEPVSPEEAPAPAPTSMTNPVMSMMASYQHTWGHQSDPCGARARGGGQVNTIARRKAS